MKPNVIFVGAGPIGLLAAIQLRLQCPKKEILMFEKYPTPQRNHAMYVDSDSFAKMDRGNGFGAILDSISSKIQISDLENKLRNYATRIGIQINYREITNFKQLQKEYPETQYFVGSGGLRGIIHPQAFNSENQINEPLRYAIEVKYKAIGKSRKLSKLTEIPSILSYAHHLVSEYVGHEKEGLTPVSLRIFIDANTYEKMKDASFKKPFTLAETEQTDPALCETIKTYLSGRKHLAHETIKEDTLKISAITMGIYASKEFCKEIDGKTVVKIGEEAFACPFYRSFNDNAACIPSFVKSMKGLFTGQSIESKKFNTSSTLFSISSLSKIDETPLKHYQRCMQEMVNRENVVIHILNKGIDVLESTVMSSQAVPQFSGSKLKLQPGGKTFLHEMNAREQRKYGIESEEHHDTSMNPTHYKSCTII